MGGVVGFRIMYYGFSLIPNTKTQSQTMFLIVSLFLLQPVVRRNSHNAYTPGEGVPACRSFCMLQFPEG